MAVHDDSGETAPVLSVYVMDYHVLSPNHMNCGDMDSVNEAGSSARAQGLPGQDSRRLCALRRVGACKKIFI